MTAQSFSSIHESQSALNQQFSAATFKERVEQIRHAVASDSTSRYAIDSYRHALGTDVANPTPDGLRLWLATMLLQGKKTSTCRRYLGVLHAIYSDCATTADDPFARILPLLEREYPVSVDEPRHNLAVAPRVVENSAETSHAIISYLLYNVSATIQDVASLTFDSVRTVAPRIDAIVDNLDRSRGRRYLFPLGQGKVRPARIVRDLTLSLGVILRQAGMRFTSEFNRLSLTAVWITAALRAEVSLPAIRALISDVPTEYSPIGIVTPATLSEPEREHILSIVADVIADDDSRWMVMKLRRGTTPDDISRRLASRRPAIHSAITLFYPTRPVARQQGRRRVVDQEPYLPDILFFKARRNHVGPLFAAICDLAWCFRISQRPDSPPAVIPHSQMATFQRCIARFTPDISIQLTDLSPALTPGRRVRIDGGMMDGFEGEILDVRPGNNEQGHTFLLRISNSKALKWTANIPSLFITPLD